MHISNIKINSVVNYLENTFSESISFFNGLVMKLKLALKGIECGGKTKFYGLTIFKRSSNSSISIGERCVFRSKSSSNLIGINRPCIISSIGEKSVLSIGDNCGFSGTVIGCFQSITIGDEVKCGANTLITDSDWHPEDVRASQDKPIVIGNNVWLGEGVKVLKGVTIGSNTVIGAGSIVVKNIPSNVIAAGNPCKVIKTIK